MRRISFLSYAGFVVAAACLLASQSGVASPQPVRALIPYSDPVALPGVGRVLIGFVLTVVVGVVAVYALRRWLPRFGGHTQLAGNLRVVGRANVHNGLRLHVVEVAGRTVLVAEGKSGIAMTLLSDGEPKESQPVP